MGAPIDLPRRRLTVENFHAMVDAGVLAEDDRVELVEGELVQMAPIRAVGNTGLMSASVRKRLSYRRRRNDAMGQNRKRAGRVGNRGRSVAAFR